MVDYQPKLVEDSELNKVITAEYDYLRIEGKAYGMFLKDLITLAAKLLDDPQIGKRVARHYKYLFVDEFHEKMIENGVKVFVIGDKKQKQRASWSRSSETRGFILILRLLIHTNCLTLSYSTSAQRNDKTVAVP